jgi:hypothetical protein
MKVERQDRTCWMICDATEVGALLKLSDEGMLSQRN